MIFYVQVQNKDFEMNHFKKHHSGEEQNFIGMCPGTGERFSSVPKEAEGPGH